MKIILRKDVDKLGKVGDVVIVKDGYARNFLIPRSFAFVAKEGAMKRIEIERKQHSNITERAKAAAQELAAKIADAQVTISMKVGEGSKLYGSVNTQLISSKLIEMGYEIDRHAIIIDEPIKTLGIFDVKIKLHPEIISNVKVWVIAEEEEVKVEQVQE